MSLTLSGQQQRFREILKRASLGAVSNGAAGALTGGIAATKLVELLELVKTDWVEVELDVDSLDVEELDRVLVLELEMLETLDVELELDVDRLLVELAEMVELELKVEVLLLEKLLCELVLDDEMVLVDDKLNVD